MRSGQTMDQAHLGGPNRPIIYVFVAVICYRRICPNRKVLGVRVVTVHKSTKIERSQTRRKSLTNKKKSIDGSKFPTHKTRGRCHSKSLSCQESTCVTIHCCCHVCQPIRCPFIETSVPATSLVTFSNATFDPLESRTLCSAHARSHPSCMM